MAMGPFLSIITLNANGLNAPSKRQRQTEWIQKQDPYICSLSTRDPPQSKGHIQTESEGLEKNISPNGDHKEVGVAILISDKIDFKIKAVKRDKEVHYITIKGSIQEGDITIINIYAPNIGAPQYVRLILMIMKEEINSNTIIVGEFNTPLWIDQLNRKLTWKHKL